MTQGTEDGPGSKSSGGTGRPEYTPRRHLEGVLSSLEDRESAVKTILGTNVKADRDTIHYLQGYYDALNLVTDEVRQAKDAEIMGITPSENDE